MTKYILTARDKSLTLRPRKMWIFDNEDDCRKTMDFLSVCKNDWTTPSYFEVEEIILNGENL